MASKRDPFRIPRSGWEAAPAAGLATIDVNANGGALGQSEFIAESCLGGIAVYAIYQALLTGLRTEALRRQGLISRGEQMSSIGATVVVSVREGALTSVGLAVLLLVCPWLGVPLTLVGVIGLGKASFDLFYAFWDGLNASQRAEIMAAAHEAGVDLRRMIDGEGPEQGMA